MGSHKFPHIALRVRVIDAQKKKEKKRDFWHRLDANNWKYHKASTIPIIMNFVLAA